MIQQAIINKCTRCPNDTGVIWKALCRDCWKNQSPDEIRAYRQAKIDRKVARLRKWADSRDSKAENLTSDFRELSKDLAWVTQPNINSSRGRAFKNSRIRVLNKYDSGMRLHNEASDLRAKADYLEKVGARVKGDSDRKRQAERNLADSIFKVGDIVSSWIVGQCQIVKINKKTYTVKSLDSGSVFTQDKSFVRIPKGKEVNICQ